jgi:amylosucrase
MAQLTAVIDAAKQQRQPELSKFDAAEVGWYLAQDAVAYNLYVDLFSTDIKGLIKKIPYLQELGVTILHLMPILQGRPGENDGGYAVMDYKQIDASLGSMDDFQRFVKALQQLIAARKANTILHSSVKERYPDAMNPHVFVTTRSEGERVFIGLFNVSDSPQYIAPTTLFPEETKKEFQDIFQQRRVPLNVKSMVLGPYEYYWLISQ